MANEKQRYVNTRFWNDTYIADLDPSEKLLFVYLITNSHTNISGIYEVPKKIIALETGFEVSMIDKILPRLQEKIRYIKGKVVIKNFIKHQKTGSPLVDKGIVNCLQELDKDYLKMLVDKGYYVIPQEILDTLSIPYTYSSNYSNSNSNLDSNSNSDAAKEVKKEELPDWLDKKAWEEWERHRKEIKKTLTPTSKKKQIDFLEKNKQCHVEIIETSISQGWTGLFPLKRTMKPANGLPAKQGKYANQG